MTSSSGLTDLCDRRTYVGSRDQLFGVRALQLDDGPQRGVRLLDVDTGGGLRLDVSWTTASTSSRARTAGSGSPGSRPPATSTRTGMSAAGTTGSAASAVGSSPRAGSRPSARPP